MSAIKTIWQFIDDHGWSDATAIILLTDYIDKISPEVSSVSLETYLKDRVVAEDSLACDGGCPIAPEA